MSKCWFQDNKWENTDQTTWKYSNKSIKTFSTASISIQNYGEDKGTVQEALI